MNKTTLTRILCVLVFALLATLLSFIMPRKQSNFSYYFEQGKPWNYDLLTAQQAFPIYKTEAELQTEQEEVLRNYTPFFIIEPGMADSLISGLQAEDGFRDLSQAETHQLEASLRSIYQKGVMSADDNISQTKEGWKDIKIVNEKHVAEKQSLSTVFTPKSAYAALMQQMQDAGYKKPLDMNIYIIPNLHYDTLRSEQLYADLVSSVSLTRGMVQQGEKIIDRGEIVSESTYQILVSLRAAADEEEVDQRQSTLSFLGMIFLVCIMLGMLVLYLFMFRPHLLNDIRNSIFISVLMAIVILLAALILKLTDIPVYAVPFALVPIMLRVFYDSRTAFFCHLVTVMLVSLMLPSAYVFVLVEVAVGLVTVVSLKDVSVRAQLLATAAYAFLTQALVFTAFHLAFEGGVAGLGWEIYLYFLASALLLLPVYGLIYLAERGFGFTSALTLVELTNVNSGLLLEFAQRAPGTFQHSLQVSNLATEAAKKINANALLVRVGALYHDIGKMTNPEMFVENQADGANPLITMDEQQAAAIIIAHVSEGLRMAKKKHLPSLITSFIASHHGTSKVRYFYNKYVNAHPGIEVDEALFRYPGPKPQTREAGILMMADAVEARSRSLSQITEQSIADMVETMVSQQIADGELSETPLSLKDVEDIKRVFTESLCSMYHHRIAYPELKK